jgi:hypothetical protein
MNLTDCPEAVRDYLTLANTDDPESALATFTETAEVTDDGHRYRGTEEIRTWLTRTANEFTYTTTPLTAHNNETTTTVTSRVEGDFPGSPVILDYDFHLAENRITSLEITVHQPE